MQAKYTAMIYGPNAVGNTVSINENFVLNDA